MRGRKICAALGVCVWDGVYMNEACMGFIPWQEANSITSFPATLIDLIPSHYHSIIRPVAFLLNIYIYTNEYKCSTSTF